jgi:uncharacterized membrane protein YvbJ
MNVQAERVVGDPSGTRAEVAPRRVNRASRGRRRGVPSKQEVSMSIETIIIVVIIVLIVLAVLGYFGRGRFGR